MTTTLLDVVEGQAFECDQDVAGLLDRRLAGFHSRHYGCSVVKRVVGHLTLRKDIHLRIRSSKAAAANLMAWVAYVDPTLDVLGKLEDLPQASEEGDLAEVVARLYCLTLDGALKRSGLLRRYSRTKESQAIVRGRIDFPKLIRNGGASAQTPCEVWRRMTDTPLNRLLAAALHDLQRTATLRGACRVHLNPLLSAMEGVPRQVPPRMLRGKEPLGRLEREFETTAVIARWLLRRGGLEDGVDRPGLGFLLNLEALFEKAVERAFRQAGLEVQSQEPLRYQRRGAPDGAFLADLYCPDVGGAPLIVDAKFKSKISSANLQQMVTYCLMTGAKRAVLVVPGEKSDIVAEYSIPTVWEPIEVRVVEFDTSGKSVEEWERTGRELVGAAF